MVNRNLLGFLLVTDYRNLDTLRSVLFTRRYPSRLRESTRFQFARLESLQFVAKYDNDCRLSPFAKPAPFELSGLWNALLVPRRTAIFANLRIAGRLMSVDHEGHRYEHHYYVSPCREQ